MPDSFDLSFFGADYYALLPDYSANALWAGRPEKIPAGLYHMRITDTRSSLLRGREYLVLSLLILEGARRGRTILVITHDRELIESCCENIVEVEKRSS